MKPILMPGDYVRYITKSLEIDYQFIRDINEKEGLFLHPNGTEVVLFFNIIVQLKITPGLLAKSYYEKDGERVDFDYTDITPNGEECEYYNLWFEEEEVSLELNNEYWICDIKSFAHLQQILRVLFEIELKLEI